MPVDKKWPLKAVALAARTEWLNKWKCRESLCFNWSVLDAEIQHCATLHNKLLWHLSIMVSSSQLVLFSPSCKNGCDLGTSSTFFVDKDKASDKTMNLSAVLRGKSFYQVRKFSISSIIIPILTPAVHIVTYFLIMFTSIHKNW